MALYVIYESPLQMLADNPQHYRREPDVTRFIAAVPTTWDETRPLLGKIGDYVAIARRKGDTWWVGALTDWEPRTLLLDLTFLGAGRYQMESYRDGVNAGRHGGDYVREVQDLEPRTPLEVRLAPGGGWVARLAPARP
jgi:alpha-glucosidase